jgi:hypothetical protein
MSKVIYKYGPLTGLNTIEVQGRIVHAEFREKGTFTAERGIYVWAEVDKTEGVTNLNYDLDIVGTGEEFTGKYHKTVVMPDGLVWHVVEVK